LANANFITVVFMSLLHGSFVPRPIGPSSPPTAMHNSLIGA
jgi:hypothetical protein